MLTIIRRADWGTRHGAGNVTNGAKLHLFVHHSAVPRPGDQANEADERTEVRNIESFHAGGLTAANPRIGYTFLIAPSGRVYEGTGWGRVGAHTRDRNSSSYGICLMMDGRVTPATTAAIAAFDALRADGVRLGHLAADHTVRGHRDVVATTCPGDLVYDAIVRRAPPAPTGREAIAPMPTLRQGVGGRNAPSDIFEAVRELQRRLGMAPQHRTGFFGPLTDKTVRDFQRASNLTVDGVVGPATWSKLL